MNELSAPSASSTSASASASAPAPVEQEKEAEKEQAPAPVAAAEPEQAEPVAAEEVKEEAKEEVKEEKRMAEAAVSELPMPAWSSGPERMVMHGVSRPFQSHPCWHHAVPPS